MSHISVILDHIPDTSDKMSPEPSGFVTDLLLYSLPF